MLPVASNHNSKCVMLRLITDVAGSCGYQSARHRQEQGDFWRWHGEAAMKRRLNGG